MRRHASNITPKHVALLLVVAVTLVFLFARSPKKENESTNIIPEFVNRCTTTPVLAKREGFQRLPTLVIYVFAETSDIKISNFQFFLQHGLCEDCSNLDIAIIINGNHTQKIPDHKNIKVYRRENNKPHCGDFGAWEFLFEILVKEKKLKRYKRIMFINDTVRGPFINPNFLVMFSQDFHFTDLFSAAITEDTRYIGSYIHCGNLDPVAVVGFSHVQTMSFMLDDVALELSRPLMTCYESHSDTITYGEIGLSKNLIKNNINIGTMMYAYKGIDFRCNDQLRHRCNDLKYAVFPDNYFEISVNPMEVVFIKATPVTRPNWELLDTYRKFLNHSGVLV
eukprot:Phypoly_transcript_13472.p1 GENE.Phypoly_transcript_13472~~Phypoly_transcript_13472.p1  ORF type:complete len:337 (+),score=31.49 Phypoly_transcript_13472:29-1039(+)